MGLLETIRSWMCVIEKVGVIHCPCLVTDGTSDWPRDVCVIVPRGRRYHVADQGSAFCC